MSQRFTQADESGCAASGLLQTGYGWRCLGTERAPLSNAPGDGHRVVEALFDHVHQGQCSLFECQCFESGQGQVLGLCFGQGLGPGVFLAANGLNQRR